jgi:prophage maintenance system killer protein
VNETTGSIGKVALYRAADGAETLEVRLERESVWLTLNQMAELFERDKSVISRHLSRVFASGELEREATVAKNATVQIEAGRSVERSIEYFNLDAILSVGYRVNSRRGTQFRIWATRTLRDYLVQGYTLNERRLRERGLSEMEQAIRLLATTLERNALVSEEGRAVLDVVRRYARSWVLLRQYDERSLPSIEKPSQPLWPLDPLQARQAIASLSDELTSVGEAGALFARETGDRLSGILSAVEQTFDGTPLYPSVEEKAAHLLYFIIKDHPFADGNKRVGSFLFVLYLKNNGKLDDSRGIARFGDTALVALALLIAESEPTQKDLMIRLIVNLLSGVEL